MPTGAGHANYAILTVSLGYLCKIFIHKQLEWRLGLTSGLIQGLPAVEV